VMVSGYGCFVLISLQAGQQTLLSVLYSSVRQWSFVETKLSAPLSDQEMVSYLL
jgi:hypothetical protein